MTDEPIDEMDPLRRLRPDRLQPSEPNDPWVLAGERDKLMSMIEQDETRPVTQWPAMYPRIGYQDEAAALEWLQRVFGFKERREARMDADEKWGMLAWLELGDGVVMIGRVTHEIHGIYSPAETDGRNTCMINVRVHDIDAHYERAQREGAEIAMEINDAFYGDRRYEARDLEGHTWHFTEPLSEVNKRRGE